MKVYVRLIHIIHDLQNPKSIRKKLTKYSILFYIILRLLQKILFDLKLFSDDIMC